MSEHLQARSRTRDHPAPGRLRAFLGLGVALGLGTIGTFAYWTDDVQITGATFTAGTLDLVVNDGDPYATTTLSMGTMVPGSSVAEVLVFKNNDTAPLKYTMTGGLTGTHAADYNTAAANGLLLTISRRRHQVGNGQRLDLHRRHRARQCRSPDQHDDHVDHREASDNCPRPERVREPLLLGQAG